MASKLFLKSYCMTVSFSVLTFFNLGQKINGKDETTKRPSTNNKKYRPQQITAIKMTATKHHK